ncbi:nardilysin-like isoform X2 [Babylonia areolata]|uniref:nardilysin-like isoform X2 n=1 Tax=Babylonia areolata TaxID=304850 RepID=UPI003FD6AB18
MSHILKSPYDKKNYREITLNNGMTALLISDMDQVTLRPYPVHRHAPRCHRGSSHTDDILEESEMEMEYTDMRTSCETSDDSMCEIPQVSGLLPALARKISYDEEKKAAAALCVGVGSFCDPEDIPGFAHFLEHMVFMGSKKYKKENAFDDFISKHGGESNAWTDTERTVFFFDIHKDHFRKSLDMFAQFFISPLFVKSSVEREIMAVDNEFQMIKYNDNDRFHQLLGTLASKGNPISRFLCGNQDTLKNIPKEKKIEVHGSLQEFSRRMYSAHYMTLVVQCPEQLDTLEDMVCDLFEDVPNNGLLRPAVAQHRPAENSRKRKAEGAAEPASSAFRCDLCHRDCRSRIGLYSHRKRCSTTMDPFVPRNFHKLLKVVPVEDCQRVDICWPLPPLYKQFKCKPLEYLAVLITHEGPGSIMSCLRKKGLALSLYGGNSGSGFDQNNLWSSFNVTILLTDAGMEGVIEVVSIVFEYIAMLSKCGPQAWFYKELCDIENIKFRFREECDPIENVEQIAENMQLFPLEHYLTGRSLMLTYDAQLIRECLNQLIPGRASITLWTKVFEGAGVCDKVEPWFGTHYTITDIPEEWERRWQNLTPRPELALPERNEFIPSNFDLLKVDGAAAHPVQVLDNQFGRMWYKKDTKFKMPKGFILLHFMTPVVASSVKSKALCDLYISVLEQQLLETLFAASLTGYEFMVEGIDTGLVVELQGFCHKLPHVMELFVTHLSRFSVTEELFKAVKSHLKKTYYNEMIKTYELAKMLRFAVTEPNSFPVPERYQAIDSLTMPMLTDFQQHMMGAFYVEGLMTGNFSPQHAVDVGNFVLNKLCRKPLPTDLLPVKRILKLPTGDLQCRVKSVNRRDTNSCVTSYFQFGPGNIRTVCLNELLMARMKEPVFNKLRTELQLGYSVFCHHVLSSGVLGFAVTVETHGHKFSMSDVENHISDFLEDFKKTMNKMSKSQFIDLVNSVITAKQVEDTQLGDETNRFWKEILERDYIFDRQEREIDILATISQSELKAWYQKYMDASHRHISFQVEGCKHIEMEMDRNLSDSRGWSPGDENILQLICEGENFIDNIEEFRQSLELYPVCKLTS